MNLARLELLINLVNSLQLTENPYPLSPIENAPINLPKPINMSRQHIQTESRQSNTSSSDLSTVYTDEQYDAGLMPVDLAAARIVHSRPQNPQHCVNFNDSVSTYTPIASSLL